MSNVDNMQKVLKNVKHFDELGDIIKYFIKTYEELSDIENDILADATFIINKKYVKFVLKKLLEKNYNISNILIPYEDEMGDKEPVIISLMEKSIWIEPYYRNGKGVICVSEYLTLLHEDCCSNIIKDFNKHELNDVILVTTEI